MHGKQSRARAERGSLSQYLCELRIHESLLAMRRVPPPDRTASSAADVAMLDGSPDRATSIAVFAP